MTTNIILRTLYKCLPFLVMAWVAMCLMVAFRYHDIFYDTGAGIIGGLWLFMVFAFFFFYMRRE